MLHWSKGPASGFDRRAILEDDVLSHSDPATGLPVGPRAARVSGPNQAKATATDALSSEELLAAILTSLDDDKAEEVVTIDLRGRSDMPRL